VIRPARVAIVLLAVSVASCSSGGDDAATTTTTSAPTTTSTTAAPSSTEAPVAPVLDQIGLAVDEIATLDAPIALAARPSSADLYIAEKRGTVRLVKVTRNRTTDPPRYQLQTTPLLDLSEDVIDGSERGLLGMAFSTDGRRLYLDYTAEPDGRTVVVEYQMDGSTGIDEDSRRVLLEVDQPYANHNGGHLAVGRDGYLYVSLGDGGDAGDPHGNGQDPTTLLGSILRIDPLGAAEGAAYAIPPGNPFADGRQGAPEVWLYGVRNPWRFSFDRTSGDLWVADVGQNEWEEVTRLPSDEGFDAGRGANLGWDRMEGTHEFEGPNPDGAVLPLYEYSHDDGGCSITGGFVYRGESIGPLQGAYLFADYCRPGLGAIQVDGDTVIDERIWTDLGVEGVQSFGEDTEGEVFVLLASGPVLKLVPPGG
jgi:glucose/arabinose dehydrogenase